MGALEPAEDVARIAALADRLNGRAGLRVDINARWDRFTANVHLPALVEAGIELIEQPTPTEQVEVLAELNRSLPVQFMADESVQSPHDALEVARRDAAGVIAVKTTKLGGLTRGKEAVAVARAAGIACHAATSLEGPIGTVASLHLACAEPGFNYGSELFGPLLLAETYVTEPIRYEEGRVHLPEGPGLGVEPDHDAVERFTRR